MKGVLVIAHGSRAKETEADLLDVLSMVRAKMPETVIEPAFMEFSERTFEKGVEALAEKGVTEIKIVPYFLFMGIHLKEDIPGMAEEYGQRFPKVKFTMGKPFGADSRLADIVADRIRD